jgi:hypothetical protein
MIITIIVTVWSKKEMSEQKMYYFGPEWEPRNCHQLVTFRRVRILGDFEPLWKVLEHLHIKTKSHPENIFYVPRKRVFREMGTFDLHCVTVLSCIWSPTDIYFIRTRAIASGTYFNTQSYFKLLPILITQCYEYYLTRIPVAARSKAWVRRW